MTKGSSGIEGLDLMSVELAGLLKVQAEQHPNFKKFTHYHRYAEVQFYMSEMKPISTPQWAHIERIEKEGEGWVITIAVFDDYKFYSRDICLKHPLLKVL
jgi:hypothetical protein